MLFWSLFSVFVLLISGVLVFAEEDVAVAKIGDLVIRASDLDKKIEEIPQYARKNFLKAEGKRKILENMIKSEVLSRAAMDAGYEKDPEIRDKIEEAKKRILQSEYFKREIKDSTGVSEKELVQYYEEHKEEYKLTERIKVAHILTDTEDEALAVRNKLDSGVSFSEAAKKESKDFGSRNDGGTLGYITRGSYIKNIGKSEEFENAAFKLEVGQYSRPVQTLKGWHIISVLERQDKAYKPLDEVRSEIASELMVTEEMVREEYDRNKADYMTRARVKVQHIQFEEEAQAKEIRAKLLQGADWAEMCRLHSQDKASAAKSGDIGYIYESGYIRGIGKDEEFERVAFGMTTGAISEVVKTAKGYHLIKLLEKDSARQKAYDEVHSQIRNKLLRDAKENSLERNFDKLKSKYKVKVYEENIVDSPDDPNLSYQDTPFQPN